MPSPKHNITDLGSYRQFKFGSLSEPFMGGNGMRTKTGLLFAILSTMIGSAAAQDAKSVLQAADKAMGASAVNSVQYPIVFVGGGE